MPIDTAISWPSTCQTNGYPLSVVRKHIINFGVMYKKLLIIVGIIISLVIIISLLGFAIIKKIDEAEKGQTLAFKVLSRAEDIHSHMGTLSEIKTRQFQMKDDNSRRAFWREYDETLIAVDKLVAPLHNGDCEGCHTEFLRLNARLLSLNDNLSKADRRRLSGSPQSLAIDRAVRDDLRSLQHSANKIERLAVDEREQAAIETMGIEANQDKGEGRQVREARAARARTLAARAKSIKSSIGLLSEGVHSFDARKIQAANIDLSRLIQPMPAKPSLKEECYGCHYTITGLSKHAREISSSASNLFITENANIADDQAINAVQITLEAFEESIAEIHARAEKARATAMKAAQGERARLKIFITTVGITIVVLTIGMALSLLWWVRRRLSSLSKGIEAVTEGDYTYMIDAGANDEIADLAHAFNLMVSKVRSSQEMLTSLNAELENMNINTVKAFIQAIEAKDPYTRGHSENVARYGVILGRHIGLNAERLEHLHNAALLHDVGKIGIREDVLNKKSGLSEREYDHVKIHPSISAQIVGKIPNLAHISVTILHHHECYSGEGYPGGLSGKNIPLEARILAIADTFDALTSNRPYRDGCTKKEALRELERHGGTQFDPELVKAFIAAMSSADINDEGGALSIA